MTYLIIRCSAAMLDAVFAEVQQVFHQSMEFPLHCLSHRWMCYLLLYVYIYTTYFSIKVKLQQKKGVNVIVEII